MAAEDYFAEFRDRSKALSTARLTRLSNLGWQELHPHRGSWLALPVERRRQVVDRLVDLAEDNVELNFHAVLRLCLSDVDGEVRRKAIDGLWECEERWLIDQLIALLLEDAEEGVRATAALALGRFVLMAELEELRPKDADKVEAALFGVLENPAESLEVRRRAVEAIGPRSSPRVSAIISQSFASADLRLKASALHAMGGNGDPAWLPLLLQELGSPYPELRYEAALALGELGEEEAVPSLTPLLQDPDTEVRLAAIGALGSIGGDLAKAQLQRCLSHPQSAVREAAAAALEELQFNEDPLHFGLN